MAIKTARDILEENSDDEKSSKGEERDQVDEAYESISKKLESLRKGEQSDRNPEEKEESVNEEDEEEMEGEGIMKDHDDDSDKSEQHEKKKPEDEEDPLDQEDLDDGEKDDNDKEKDEVNEENPLDDVEEPEKSSEDKEETLDDLVEESEEDDKAKQTHSSINEDLENDMHIPNLRSNSSNNASYTKRTFSQNRSMNQNLEDEYPPQDPSKFFNRHTSSTPRTRSSKWHLLILILIGIVVISGTVYLLKGQFKNVGVTPAPSPEPSVEPAQPSPSPSPSPSVERSKYKIRVLNGTTKTGLAASVSAKLKELGYQTDRTGNATNSALERTQIRAKSSLSSLIDQIIRDLTGQFDTASSSSSLKESDSADAEVILGAK